MLSLLYGKNNIYQVNNNADLDTQVKTKKRNVMEISTISTKGQVTIPKKIRDFLNVRTYDKITFIPLKDGQVLITTKQNSATSLFGMLKHRKPEKHISIEDMEAIIRVRRAKRGMR